MTEPTTHEIGQGHCHVSVQCPPVGAVRFCGFSPSEPVEHRACCQVLLDAKTCNGRMSSRLVVCLQVRDIAFLHRYNEPTLLILHEVITLGL